MVCGMQMRVLWVMGYDDLTLNTSMTDYFWQCYRFLLRSLDRVRSGSGIPGKPLNFQNIFFQDWSSWENIFILDLIFWFLPNIRIFAKLLKNTWISLENVGFFYFIFILESSNSPGHFCFFWFFSLPNMRIFVKFLKNTCFLGKNFGFFFFLIFIWSHRKILECFASLIPPHPQICAFS